MSEQEQRQAQSICNDAEELNSESRRALEAFKAGVKAGFEIASAKQAEQKSA